MVFYARGVAMDPVTFPNPHVFDPNRWKDPSLAIKMAPFGNGFHRCKGEYFALAVMKTTLAVLIQNYDVEIISGSEEVKWESFWPRVFPTIRLHKRQ